jgi:hypothetical protein
MQHFKISVLLLFCLLAFTQNAQAQATLSVQGSIQKSTGAAIDDGDYAITFKFYTSETGGTDIWSETQDPVEIIGGVYSVTLGSVNPLTVPFNQPYFLGISVGTGQEHTPRTRLTSAPYALSLLGQDNQFPSTGIVNMGSIATEERSTAATTVAVDAKDHVIFLDHTANQNITLPAASASEGRHLMLVNKAAVAKTLTASNYLDITNVTNTTIPAQSIIELQSDGSVWRQTGGYVTPGVTEKAFVYCTGAGHSVNSNVTATLSWVEVTDSGNNFSNGTTFTAPRTGVYHLNGMIAAGGFANTNSVGVSFLFLEGTCQLCNVNVDELIGRQFIPIGQVPWTPFAADVYLTAGQTFLVKWFHNTGGNQNHSPNGNTFMTIREY